jgi:excinuclease UvrABC ATPase subunit
VDTGSTVVVVEHDAETIQAADYILDLGPGGGHHGGRIEAAGPAHEVLAKDGPTAAALRARATWIHQREGVSGSAKRHLFTRDSPCSRQKALRNVDEAPLNTASQRLRRNRTSHRGRSATYWAHADRTQRFWHLG